MGSDTVFKYWEFWASIGLTLILIISALVGFLKSGGTLQAGKLTLKPYRKGDDSRVNPHQFCPHAKDILKVVMKTTEYCETKHYMRDELIDTQMRYFDEKEIELKGYLQKVFIDALQIAVPIQEDLVQNQEYINYNLALMGLSREIREYVKIAILKNHFISDNDTEWQERKRRYKTSIIQKGVDFLNIYWRGSTIPRYKLYEANHSDESIAEINKTIDDMFEYARTCAVENDNKINKVKDEYEEFLKSNIG
jgi:hypothetical protein